MVSLRVILVLLILLSCACTSTGLKRARSAFYSGTAGRAEDVLDECRGVSKKDRLLCYMEGGAVLYDSEAYGESTEVFLNASRLMKRQDLVSITDQSSAVLINDRVMAYKGEYSERLWVHTYLMMDYILQHKYEDALVEAKQALELYDEYPDSLADDHFTRALIALCFENMNLWDDARIEYDKLAGKVGRDNVTAGSAPDGKGELILFVAQGRVPRKVSSDIVIPPSIRISVPRYDDASPPGAVDIQLDHSPIAPPRITTDLGDVARRSLDDRAAQYLTRQTLRAGAKEAIARKAGDQSEFAEALVRMLLFLSEEADTRSWETLPESLTLVRIRLDPGIHDLGISSEYYGTVRLDGIHVADGERLYRSVRF